MPDARPFAWIPDRAAAYLVANLSSNRLDVELRNGSEKITNAQRFPEKYFSFISND